MKRNYPRLGIVEFGMNLFDTQDLDPVYVALLGCLRNDYMTLSQVKRWLVAYWSFYSCGVSSYLSELEGKDFWEAYKKAVENVEPPPPGGRWERGHERRHFRGDNARKAMEDLRTRYPVPQHMVSYIAELDAATLRYETVSARVQSHVGFGPWIAWKVADMLNALGIAPVSFEGADLSMYRDPVKGAKMLWVHTLGTEDGEPTDREAIRWAVDLLQDSFRNVPVPHAKHRTVGLEEIETVLCKWKSHRNGSYPLGTDIHEIREGLERWSPYSQAAQNFLTRLPGGEAGFKKV